MSVCASISLEISKLRPSKHREKRKNSEKLAKQRNSLARIVLWPLTKRAMGWKTAATARTPCLKRTVQHLFDHPPPGSHQPPALGPRTHLAPAIFRVLDRTHCLDDRQELRTTNTNTPCLLIEQSASRNRPSLRLPQCTVNLVSRT